MSDYAAGHVKRNPENGTIALRTHFPDNSDFTNMLWLISNVVHGPSHAGNATVEGWDDLFVPTVS